MADLLRTDIGIDLRVRRIDVREQEDGTRLYHLHMNCMSLTVTADEAIELCYVLSCCNSVITRDTGTYKRDKDGSYVKED